MLLLCSGDDRDGLITRLVKSRGCDWKIDTLSVHSELGFRIRRLEGASSVRMVAQALAKLVVPSTEAST